MEITASLNRESRPGAGRDKGVAKVLSLFSGSLASRVATRLVEQCPEVTSVHLLHFRSPFSREFGELRQLVKTEWSRNVFRTQSIKKEYRRLVGISPDGEFSLSRSCSTCRSLLLAKAVRYMERIGADYVVTGEIPGKHALNMDQILSISDRFDATRRVLRPLCSGIPPRDGGSVAAWADGRARTSSSAGWHDRLRGLAAEMGLRPDDPLDSCRRCKLTTPGFGDRVASLFGENGFTLNALRLLDFECFYKVDPDVKIVLARDESEKRELQTLFLPQDLRVYPSTPHGPMTLVRTDWSTKRDAERKAVIEFAARITATFVGPGRAALIPIYYRLEMEDETLLLNSVPFGSLDEIGRFAHVEVIPLELTEVPVA